MRSGLSRLIPAVLISLMLLAAIASTPIVVMGDEEGSSSGTFTVQNQPPEVTSIVLKDESDTNTIDPSSGMTPTNTYNLHIEVSDANGYETITEVVVYIYYATATTDDPSGTFNTQLEAIFRWDKDHGWELVENDSSWTEPSGTTWSVDTSNSQPASGSGPTGSGSTAQFVVKFTVGKVAKRADGTNDFWIIAVKAKDDQGQWSDLVKDDEDSSGSVSQYVMNPYGEIGIEDTSFDFGTVSMGSSDNPIQTPDDGKVDIYVVANTNYDIQVKTDSQWIGQSDSSHTVSVVTTDPTSSDGVIRIKLDSDSDTQSYDLDIPTDYTKWKSGSGPTNDGDASSGGGDHYEAYMRLDVGLYIPADTYGGNVYFKVVVS